MHRNQLRRLAVASVLPIAATLVLAPAAEATYPGRNGQIVFGGFYTTEAGRTADLWSVKANGNKLTRLTQDDALDLCAAASPDGERLATCRNEEGVYEIWTRNADGSDAKQVTALNGAALFPDWFPDGRRIAFYWSPEPDAPTSLHVVDTRTGEVTLLAAEPGWSLQNPVVSPDGTTVLYTRARFDSEGEPLEGQLWTIDLTTRTKKQLTFDNTFKDQTADWRPDGRQIAYMADDDIWTMNPDGTNQRNLTATPDAGEFGTSFSPDGRWIAFTGDGGPVPAGERYVQVMRTDGTHRRIVVETPGVLQAVPAWLPRPKGQD